MGHCKLHLPDLGQGLIECSYGQGTETSGSIKDETFLE
jgi:hypothetical protein